MSDFWLVTIRTPNGDHQVAVATGACGPDPFTGDGEEAIVALLPEHLRGDFIDAEPLEAIVSVSDDD